MKEERMRRYTREARPGVALAMAIGMMGSTVGAATFTWSGGSSSAWSDGGNWVGGLAPSSASTNDVLLLPGGSYDPTNQDIAGLSLNSLTLSNCNNLAIGGQDLTLGFLVDRGLGARTNTLNCNVIMSANVAWAVAPSGARLILNGALGETGGSRYFSANENGTIELRGNNTFSGGLRNNQTWVLFHRTNNLGVLPGSLVTNFFEAGNGGWLAITTGSFSRVVIPASCGMKTTASGQQLGAGRNVKMVFQGPITGVGLAKPPNNDGLLVLAGANSLTGDVGVSSGTLRLDHPSGFGAGNPGTTVRLIGSLDLNGCDLTTRAIQFVNGFGDDSSGELKNNNTHQPATVWGDVNLGGGTGGNAFQFGGAGDIVILGTVSNATGSGTTPYALRKLGGGMLTLKGPGILAAPVSVRCGGLTLDYTASNTSKLSDTNRLFVWHGTVRLIGNDDDDTTEITGDLSIGGIGGDVNPIRGAVSVELIPGLNRNLTLACSNLTLAANFAADFSVVPHGTGAGAITVTNADHIVGGGATWNRSTWAKVASGQITGLEDGAYLTGFEAGVSNSHVDVAAGTTVVTGTTATCQTLRFRGTTATALVITNNAILKLNGLNTGLTSLRPGILMVSNAGPVTIAGAGSINPGLNQVLFVHQHSTNPLTWSAQIGGTGSGNSLVKWGPGELILANTNNILPNPSGIYGGILTIVNLRDGGSYCALGSAANIDIGNGTLKYVGSGDSHDRTIRLRGPAALDASGSGPLVFTGVTNVVRQSADAGGDFPLALTGSGAGVLKGVLDLRFGGVTKDGAGTWTLCGSQPYLGDTRVVGGTLTLSNNASLARSLWVGPGGALAGSGAIGEDLAIEGTLRIVLRGPADYDAWSVGYDATMNGTVTVETAGGYQPAPSQPFAVLTAGGTLSGTPTLGTPGYRLQQVGSTLILEAAPPAGTLLMIR